MNIFGVKKPTQTPTELAKEWGRKLTKEGRELDRSVVKLRREEDKALKECKALAKKGHNNAVKILAKEIAQTRKAVERMYMAKANMNSVALQLKTSAGKVQLRL